MTWPITHNETTANLIQNALQQPTLDMLQELLANGLDIYQKFSFGGSVKCTPMFYGIYTKKWRHVLFLLDLVLASPPRSREDYPDTILVVLLYFKDNSEENDKELECQVVLKVGRQCNQAALLRCIANKKSLFNPGLLQTLITAGADARQAANLLFLPMAPECMQILIEHGIDINYQSRDDKSSAIHHVIARYFSQPAYLSKRHLQILLVHGADLTLRDANGKTPLDDLTPTQRREIEAIQTKLEQCREQARDRTLALCMAGHPRLGANSPAQDILSDIFETIIGTRMQQNYLTLQIARVLV